MSPTSYMSARVEIRGSPSPRPSPASGRGRSGELKVEVGLGGALHDELEARLDVLAHQLAQNLVGLLGVFDRDAQQTPRLRIQRRTLELLRLHLAQALEAHDLGARVLGQRGDDAIAVGLVERPECLLAVVDAVEGWLRQV